MTVRSQIYQLVALHLGEARTTGPGDAGSVVAQRLDAIYPHEADRFLESYPWDFAMSVAQLTASEPTPADWSYGFPLPGLCRRIEGVNDRPDMRGRADIPYEVRGSRVLTNSATTWLRYVDGAYASMEGSWPAHPADAFAAHLAARICEAFSRAANKRELLLRQARVLDRRAKLWDAQQKKVTPAPLSYWQQVRLASGTSIDLLGSTPSLTPES